MVYKTADGVEIIKLLPLNKVIIQLSEHQVVNRSQQNWQGQMFGQIKRDNSDDPGKSDQGILHLGLSWWCLGYAR
jgi:YidC/Oxa1 family membrane protein insertase